MSRDTPLFLNVPLAECSQLWPVSVAGNLTAEDTTAAADESDSDCSSSEDGQETPRWSRTDGHQPAWAARRKKRQVACYDCLRFNSRSILVTAFSDGSFDVYSSVKVLEEEMSAEQSKSPKLAHFPPTMSNLLPLSLKTRANSRARHHSIASSQRSVSPPPSSITSSSGRRSRRNSTSTVRPRKASATLHVTGTEAVVSTGHQRKSSDALNALITASNAGPVHADKSQLHSLNQAATESRESLSFGWNERSYDSISENEIEESDANIDQGWLDDLHLQCTTSPALDIAAPVEIRIISPVTPDEYTKTAIILYNDGSIGRLSLADGRLSLIYRGLGIPVSPSMHIFKNDRDLLLAVKTGKTLELRNARSGRLLSSTFLELSAEAKTVISILDNLIYVTDTSTSIMHKVTIYDLDKAPTLGSSKTNIQLPRSAATERVLDISVTDNMTIVATSGNLSLIRLVENQPLLIRQQTFKSAAKRAVISGDTATIFFDEQLSIYDIDNDTFELKQRPATSLPSVMSHVGHSLGPSPFSILSGDDSGNVRFEVMDFTSEKPALTRLCSVNLSLQDSGLSAATLSPDGDIYLGTRNGRAVKLHPDLTLSRTFDTRQAGVVTFIKVFADHLYIGNSHGAFFLLDASTLEQLNRWAIFASPIRGCFSFDDTFELFKGRILVTAYDGASALIEPKSGSIQLYSNSASPLHAVYHSSSELLLTYSSGRGRIFDVATGELRRSVDSAVIAGLLSQTDTWLECRQDSASTSDCLWVNANTVTNITNASSLQSGKDHVTLTRFLLSRILPQRISKTLDKFASDQLSLNVTQLGKVCVTIQEDSVSTNSHNSWKSPFTISRHQTAQLLLASVSLSNALIAQSDRTQGSNLLLGLSSLLSDSIGPNFEPASLSYLSTFWFHENTGIRESSQALFAATLASLSSVDQQREAERWHALLPLEDLSALDNTQSTALLVCGLVAVDCHRSLPPIIIADVTRISMALLDTETTSNNHLLIAVELIARGFPFMRDYCEAVPLLRRLSVLGDAGRSDCPEIKTTSRRATLAIAELDSQALMSSLAFDVLQEETADERNSSLRLIAFVVRKKPLVLFSSVARLAETVVRSLDPRHSAFRATVQHTATGLLGELVKTYPMIDFHKDTQHLAVGTSEGAVIMYDLRTAQRLYVLPSHASPVAAVTFAPDGRRLVSVSLTEQKAAVWKVGASVFGMLTPGRPPNQHGTNFLQKDGPFKVIGFTTTSDDSMSAVDLLNSVSCAWVEKRSLRLGIREAAFTFSC